MQIIKPESDFVNYRLQINHDYDNITPMPERQDYYNIPENFQVQRINLKERPGQVIRIEQPSGQLAITFFGKDRKFPYAVTSTSQEKTLVLIASGQGKVIKEGQEFNIDGTPAVFFLDGADRIETLGDFSGWIVRLKETQPTQELPTSSTEITEKVFNPEEVKGEVKDQRFPNGQGETIQWALGQWNSKSPINVAYEAGGLGSIGDAGIFDLEDQVLEIQLTAQGRLVHRTVTGHFELDGGGNRVGDVFDFPARSGDVSIAKPGSLISASRYSGNYKGFTLKWAVKPADIINPKRKREIII